MSDWFLRVITADQARIAGHSEAYFFYLEDSLARLGDVVAEAVVNSNQLRVEEGQEAREEQYLPPSFIKQVVEQEKEREDAISFLQINLKTD